MRMGNGTQGSSLTTMQKKADGISSSMMGIEIGTRCLTGIHRLAHALFFSDSRTGFRIPCMAKSFQRRDVRVVHDQQSATWTQFRAYSTCPFAECMMHAHNDEGTCTDYDIHTKKHIHTVLRMRKSGTAIDQMREVFATSISKERPRKRRPADPQADPNSADSKMERWKPLSASNFLGPSADETETDESAALDEAVMRKRVRFDNILPEKIVSICFVMCVHVYILSCPDLYICIHAHIRLC
jgi:hypothetical protein